MALFNITAQQLKGQVDGAKQTGLVKACADAELGRKLPAGWLAIASRETNCRDIVGDGGFGRGVFQIDSRSHADFLAANPGPNGIPPLPAAANYAAGIAASGLAAAKKLALAGDAAIKFAAAAYNAGEGGATTGLKERGDPDARTTNRNYGDDVLTRLHLIQAWLGGATGPRAGRGAAAAAAGSEGPRRRGAEAEAERVVRGPPAADALR